MSLPRPDLTHREYSCTVELRMGASAEAIYRAWTERLDTWFAAPGLVTVRPEVDEPFVFYTEHAGQRHAHYGRFLSLKRDRLVEVTWLTGAMGTDGAETIVTIVLEPAENGTLLHLTHAGFYDQEAADRHDSAWREAVLPHLDEVARKYGDLD